jgi:hypothetical protein
VVNSSQGGGSKDTWVLPGPAGQSAVARAATTVTNSYQPRPLLSRVADAVYWMGRYIERAENVARFIDVNQNLMLDLPSGFGQQWQPIVDTTGDRAAFLERYGEATRTTWCSSWRSIPRIPTPFTPA